MSEKETALELRPSDLLGVITNLVNDPRMDVEKMERLLAMHERISAEQRKIAFDDAMTRLQAKLPPIAKYGKGKNSKFSKYEDIDAVVRPLIAEEGFSLSFNQEEQAENTVTFVLEVSRAGHSKLHRLTVHTDKASKNREGNSIRPPIQDDGSTASYARRYLIKLALNIIEKDEDTDGEDRESITAEQVKDIRTMIQDAGATEATFLEKIAYVDKIEDIPLKDWKRVTNALNVKIEALRRAGQK